MTSVRHRRRNSLFPAGISINRLHLDQLFRLSERVCSSSSPRLNRFGGFHRMRNLAAKVDRSIAGVQGAVTACYSAPSRAIARQLAAGIRADYADLLPSATDVDHAAGPVIPVPRFQQIHVLTTTTAFETDTQPKTRQYNSPMRSRYRSGENSWARTRPRAAYSLRRS
jgi:hypothetical protein